MKITVVRRGSPKQSPDAYRQYIGRPSPLGNPFHIGPHGTREEVVRRYRRWLWEQIQDQDEAVGERLDSLLRIAQQRPLELECHCAPLACHGDIIKSALFWMNEKGS